MPVLLADVTACNSFEAVLNKNVFGNYTSYCVKTVKTTKITFKDDLKIFPEMDFGATLTLDGARTY